MTDVLEPDERALVLQSGIPVVFGMVEWALLIGKCLKDLLLSSIAPCNSYWLAYKQISSRLAADSERVASSCVTGGVVHLCVDACHPSTWYHLHLHWGHASHPSIMQLLVRDMFDWTGTAYSASSCAWGCSCCWWWLLSKSRLLPASTYLDKVVTVSPALLFHGLYARLHGGTLIAEGIGLQPVLTRYGRSVA